jgi:hypothetical protein
MENFIRVSADYQNPMKADFWYETHEQSFFPSSFIDKGKNIDKFVKKVLNKNSKAKKKFTRLDIDLYTNSYTIPSRSLWVIIYYAQIVYRKSPVNSTLEGMNIDETEFYSIIKEFIDTVFNNKGEF